MLVDIKLKNTRHKMLLIICLQKLSQLITTLNQSLLTSSLSDFNSE